MSREVKDKLRIIGTAGDFLFLYDPTDKATVITKYSSIGAIKIKKMIK